MEHDGKLWKTMENYGTNDVFHPFFPIGRIHDPSSGLPSPGCQGRTTGLPHALRVSAPGCHGKSSQMAQEFPTFQVTLW